MRKIAWVVIISFVLCVLYASSAREEAVATIEISGFVFDSARKPILGVNVGVYVTGKGDSVAGTTVRENDGSYSVRFEVTDTFNISFTKSTYKTCVVSQLCEKHPHKISVVLYRHGEALPAAAAHAFYQSVDRVVFLCMNLPGDERDKFLRRFTADKERDFGIRDEIELITPAAGVSDFLKEEQQSVAKRLDKIVKESK
jgi:hypothetical protein